MIPLEAVPGAETQLWDDVALAMLQHPERAFLVGLELAVLGLVVVGIIWSAIKLMGIIRGRTGRPREGANQGHRADDHQEILSELKDIKNRLERTERVGLLGLETLDHLMASQVLTVEDLKDHGVMNGKAAAALEHLSKAGKDLKEFLFRDVTVGG